MQFKMILLGLNWFQGYIDSFVTKSEEKNKADQEKIEGIQAKVDERTEEIRKARSLGKNLDNLFSDED